MTDFDGRKIDYMRVSVTNECNLACKYCSPLTPRHTQSLLSPAAIATICRQAAQLGVKRIRFTGGEPLMRKDFGEIVTSVADIQEVEHISITTNGIYLKNEILNLPFDSINISINATDEILYEKLCGVNLIQEVLKNAQSAAKKYPVKINCVPLSESYKEQAEQVIKFGEEIGAAVRFIELMPMGDGAKLLGVATNQLMEYIQQKYGNLEPREKLGGGPAVYYKAKGLSQPIGFISPMTSCFCSECNRIRLLASGKLQACLAKKHTVNLAKALIDGNLKESLATAISQKQGRHNLDKEELTALKEIGG